MTLHGGPLDGQDLNTLDMASYQGDTILKVGVGRESYQAEPEGKGPALWFCHFRAEKFDPIKSRGLATYSLDNGLWRHVGTKFSW
jgi:hypothetical protein